MRRLWRHKAVIITVVAVLLVGSVGTIVFLRRNASPIARDPFTAKMLASVDFPLYYPTHTPKGFRIDAKSPTKPQDGVVIFNLIDGKGRKIYVSQEARSKSYNYGGFFNGIEQGQQFKAHFGQAVVGHLHNGQTAIASMVSNRTWVIINAKATDATPAQLKDIVNSLAASH